MTDNHFMFLVTLPIHDGSNENSEKSSGRKTFGSGNIHTTGNKRKTD